MKQSRISNFIKEAVEMGASDIHLQPNTKPCLRIDGVLQEIDERTLTKGELERVIVEAFGSNAVLVAMSKGKEQDFTYIEGDLRFRVNVGLAQGHPFAVFRYLKTIELTPYELGVPEEFINGVLSLHHGLVFVVGTTGSGKSTTLASMIQFLMDYKPVKVNTIEEPIEYILKPKKSLSRIIQREVGKDTASFSHGLRAAMRQDPDIIMVGEVRDVDTVLACLAAAETGHLVLATLHAKDERTVPWRLAGMVEPSHAPAVFQRSVELLEICMSQELIASDNGRKLKTSLWMLCDEEKKEILKSSGHLS